MRRIFFAKNFNQNKVQNLNFLFNAFQTVGLYHFAEFLLRKAAYVGQSISGITPNAKK